METKSSPTPSNDRKQKRERLSSSRSLAGGSPIAALAHLSSAEAATLRQHLAETQEQYQDAVVKLRQQKARRKATELELQLLRESPSSEATVAVGGEEGGRLDVKYQQLIQDHAIALEQREAHAEQIHSLKELVHSLNQELKVLRKQTTVQDLEEEISKWEALYYESAEMGVAQLAKVEAQLLEVQEREAKGRSEIQELRQSLQQVEIERCSTSSPNLMEQQVKILESQLEMARHAELTARENAAAATAESKRTEERVSRAESRIVDLERLLAESKFESEERISKLVNQERNEKEATLTKKLEEARAQISELENERNITKTERDGAMNSLATSHKEQYDQSQQEIQALNEELAKLQSKLDSTLEENKGLRLVKNSLHGFDKEISNVIESLETELPIAKAEHERLKTQLEEERKKTQSAIDESQIREDFLLEQLSEQTNLLQEAESKLEEAMKHHQKMEILRQSIFDLKEDLEDAEETIYQLEEENEQLQRERKSWWKQIENRSPAAGGSGKRLSVDLGNIQLR